MKDDLRQLYLRPEKLLGATVFWYADGNASEPPTPAIVSAVNMASLRLHIITTNGFRFADGVRHLSDTQVNEHERRESGCWESRQELIDRKEIERARQKKLLEENDRQEEQQRREEQRASKVPAGAK